MWIDKDGYPTEQALTRIERWATDDPVGLMDFIEKIWHWSDDYFVREPEGRFELHTGGWSGNESIIGALHNTMFWVFYWQKSTRGGHHYFTVNL